MQSVEGLACTKFSIHQDVPLQLWDALNTFHLSGAPTILNRMWNNKVVAYTVNYSQCYFHYLSPRLWLNQFGLVASLIFFGLIILCLIRFKKIGRKVLPLIAIYPVVMIFELYKLIL